MAGGYHIGLWALLLTAAICDLIWGKVFNWVNGLFLLGGLFTHFYLGGISALPSPLLSVAVAFTLFFPLYLIHAFAAGDVKLLMAIGAWSTPRTVIELGVTAIVVGSIVGLIVILKKKGLTESVKSIGQHFRLAKSENGVRIPFAPAFLCALFILQILERYR